MKAIFIYAFRLYYADGQTKVIKVPGMSLVDASQNAQWMYGKLGKIAALM